MKVDYIKIESILLGSLSMIFSIDGWAYNNRESIWNPDNGFDYGLNESINSPNAEFIFLTLLVVIQ